MYAFPRPASDAHMHGMHKPQEGMTLRDYFAAKAMQAILMAKYPVTKEPDAEHKIAAAAYQGADAMMEARNAAQ